MMSGQLELNLLGTTDIRLDGEPVTGFRSRKAQALLSYLAVTGRRHGRSALAGLLWGDWSEENARMNLSKALSNLRRLVEPHLDINRQTIGFNRTIPYRLDVEIFTSRLEKNHLTIESLQEAVATYRGDFLDDLIVQKAPEFESWVAAQRARLRELALQALHRLSVHYSQQGLDGQVAAIEYAGRILSLEPWREEAHRQMMLLLALSDQRSAALAQYDICRQVLAEELGVEPESTTVELYEQIRGGTLNGNIAKKYDGAVTFAAQPSLPKRQAALHKLPAQGSPLIGRETELADIATLLADPVCRLLTLVGPGGIGKTRLALAAAERHTDAFSDGVVFVSLAGLNSADFLVPAVASALGVTFYEQRDPLEQLLIHLKDKTLLLVLDNFEHLLAGADQVASIIRKTSKTKIVVTSRERLNLHDEWLFVVEGLSVPSETTAKGIADYEAAQLFFQRARQAQAQFGSSLPEREAVVRICRLVDGLPLGIELAAAWVSVLSPIEIAYEIERNLGFLASPLRDVPERHHSLQAVFDHSWQLLTEVERCLFRWLSVFRGGFSHSAAQSLCDELLLATGDGERENQSPSADHKAEILRLLSNLVNKSLLRHTTSNRYEIHALLLQYGAAKLRQDPQEDQRARDRHSEYFLRRLTQNETQLKGAMQQAALAEIATDIENVRAAWHSAAQQGKTSLIAAAAEAFWVFSDMQGRYHEMEATFDEIASSLSNRLDGTVNRDPEQNLALGKLLVCQGGFHVRLGTYKRGMQLVKDGLSLLRLLDAPREIAFALNQQAALVHLEGNYSKAKELLVESIALSRACGDDWLTGYSLNDLGMVTYLMGKTVEAQRLSRESLALFRQIDDKRGIAFALSNLGVFAYSSDDYEEAERLSRESLALWQASGHGWGMALTLTHLGTIARARGDFEASRANFHQAIHVALQIRARPAVVDALVELAALLIREGKQEQARDILRFSLRHPVLSEPTREFVEDLLNRLPAVTKADPAGKSLEGQRFQSLEDLVRTLASNSSS